VVHQWGTEAPRLAAIGTRTGRAVNAGDSRPWRAPGRFPALAV